MFVATITPPMIFEFLTPEITQITNCLSFVQDSGGGGLLPLPGICRGCWLWGQAQHVQSTGFAFCLRGQETQDSFLQVQQWVPFFCFVLPKGLPLPLTSKFIGFFVFAVAIGAPEAAPGMFWFLISFLLLDSLDVLLIIFLHYFS